MAHSKRMVTPRIGALASAVSSVLAGTLVTGTADAQQQAAGPQERVVVTGSRITRRDFISSSPIVTIDQEQFENISTFGVENALNQFPQFVAAQGATGAPGSGTQFGTLEVQSTADISPGISFLNLRGLGPNRSLVLIDGRRAQPSNANLVVDTNTIPAAAIESVEVISGGASAVYGADALAGVVNFKIRDDFEGVSIDSQFSGTEQGGGGERRISMLAGGNFSSGRGNAMVGVEWAERKPVYQTQREFFRRGMSDPGTTSFEFAQNPGTISSADYSAFPNFLNAPDQDVVDSLFPGLDPGTVPAASRFYFKEDGTVFVANHAYGYFRDAMGNVVDPTPQQIAALNSSLQFKILDNGNITEAFTPALTSSPLDRTSVFARGKYDITENLTAFAQGNFTSVDVGQVLFYAPSTAFWGAQVPYDGRDIPADLDTLLASRPGDNTAPWPLVRDLDFLGPRTSDNKNRVFQAMAGIEGQIGSSDWTYEAFISHGETTISTYLSGFAATDKLINVITAPDFGEGYTFNSFPQSFLGFTGTCTSGLPIFGDFTPSQDCVDTVSINMINTTNIVQDISEANFEGSVADLAHGEMRAAVGISRRRNSVDFVPDQFVDAQNQASLPVGLFASNDAAGVTTVKEVYGELSIPIVEAFSLELGARNSDYNLPNVGSVNTNKILFDWQITDQLRLRGGRQIANRAPNTAELYQGRTQAVVGFFWSDPCAVSTSAPWGNVPGNPNRAEVQALCSAIINGPGNPPASGFDADPDNYETAFGGSFEFELENREGNPALKPEEAETFTLGLVWTGEAWTAAVDWYSIEITDALAAPSALTAYEQCFNADGGSNPDYDFNDPGGFCASIIRAPDTGDRLAVSTMPVNSGIVNTSGVDVQINWDKDIGPGSLYLSLVATFLDEYKFQPAPLASAKDAAGTLDQGVQFDSQFFANATYRFGDWAVGGRFRHLPSAKDASYVSNPQTNVLPVGSYETIDVFGTWQASDRISLRAGIDNLLDTDPEIVGRVPGINNAYGETQLGVYDVLGRRGYLGINWTY